MGRQVKRMECSNKDCVGYIEKEGGLCYYGMRATTCPERNKVQYGGDFYNARYIHKTPTTKLKWMVDFVRRGNHTIQAVFGHDNVVARKELKRRRGQCS